jgi:hypothetical protein
MGDGDDDDDDGATAAAAAVTPTTANSSKANTTRLLDLLDLVVAAANVRVGLGRRLVHLHDADHGVRALVEDPHDGVGLVVKQHLIARKKKKGTMEYDSVHRHTQGGTTAARAPQQPTQQTNTTQDAPLSLSGAVRAARGLEGGPKSAHQLCNHSEGRGENRCVRCLLLAVVAVAVWERTVLDGSSWSLSTNDMMLT